MRYAHPHVAIGIEQLILRFGKVFLTDCYRDPAASLLARSTKRGVQKPGYSAHNFGLAIDLDVAKMLRVCGYKKADLDYKMNQYGFRCYRADHKADAPEAWHYTFSAKSPGQEAVEEVIQSYYGSRFKLDAHGVQEALVALRLYAGTIDGKHGPLTRTALGLFQRTWGLAETQKADEATQRLLAVVTADKEIV